MILNNSLEILADIRKAYRNNSSKEKTFRGDR